MYCKASYFLLFVLLLISFLPETLSDCRLVPISYGFYYGISQKTFTEATECCKSKQMEIVNLKTREKRVQLRDALLIESFWDEPIGPASGLYIQTNSTNNQGYYPRESSANKSESCTIIYITSPKNIDLTITGTPCHMSFRFLCQRNNKFDSSVCKEWKFTDLIEDSYIYSSDELEWRQAADCCEIKGGELLRFSASSETLDLQAVLIENGFLEHNLNQSLSFWSGGFKKLDKYPFAWENYERIMYQQSEIESEFCLKAFTSEKGLELEDFPCENSLPFVCRIKAPQNCQAVDLKPLKFLDSYQTYHYSGNYKLSWSDAVLCCRFKGFQLLSVISPQEGTMLARYMQQTNEITYRHQGFNYGLWTSGRQHQTGEFEFVSVRTKTRFDESGKNFLLGPNNGTCLQFIIDVKNSYVLSPIPCKSIRSFICENKEILPSNYKSVLKEMGNKYFYGNDKVTWIEANNQCNTNKMKLINLESIEEKAAMVEILKVHPGNHIRPNNSLWSMSKRLAISVDQIPKSEPPVNQNTVQQRRGRAGKGRRISTTNNVPKNMDSKLQTNSKSFNCFTIHASNNLIIQENLTDCTLQKKNFICEKEDPKYGKCDPNTLQNIGPYLISSQAATWNEARHCCLQSGRALLGISNTEIPTDVYSIILKYTKPGLGFWTSGSNSILTKKWIWIGNRNYDFVGENNFYHNYTYYDVDADTPENNQCLEAFVDTRRNSIALSHDDCEIPKPYVCDNKNSDFAKPPCESIRLDRLRKTQFYYGLGKTTWAQAQECCMQGGMHLAEIHNKDTNELIHDFVAEISRGVHDNPDFGLWIGLTSHLTNHTSFTWINTLKTVEEYKFSSWNPSFDYPVNPKFSCALVYTNISTFLWRNVECSKKIRFLCQSS